MKFEQALSAVKEGKKVSRTGWNGKGQFVVKFNPEYHGINEPLIDGVGKFPMDPFLVIKGANNKYTPWTPSQGDLFADDWKEESGKVVQKEASTSELKSESGNSDKDNTSTTGKDHNTTADGLNDLNSGSPDIATGSPVTENNTSEKSE